MDLKKLKKLLNTEKVKFLLLVLVLIFTFVLRSVHSDRIPGFGHLEEQMFGWSGMYLIDDGVPVAWSTLQYPKDRIIYTGPVTGDGNHAVAYVDLIKPWLDEPPLFSLIVGGSAKLFGANKEFLVPSSYLRFPMMFFALFTSIALFLLAQKLFGYWIALGSVFFWGTVPIFVFSSRLAVPENVFAFLYPLCLYLFLKYKDNPKQIYLILFFLIPGIAGLMKPTGFFIAPFIAFLFFQMRDWKRGGQILLATVPFVLAFLGYGFYYDAESFKKILEIQGMRPAGWSGLGFLFTSPSFDIFTFYDSWYILSWVAAAFFILQTNKNESLNFLSWAFIYWVLVVLFSGGEQDLLPWYRYPFFPLLAIFLTLGLRHLINNPNFINLVIAAGFLLGNRPNLVNAFHPGVPSSVFRTEFFLAVAPGLAYTLWEKEIFRKMIVGIVILLIVVGCVINILVVKDYYALICEAKTCPIGPSTFLTR